MNFSIHIFSGGANKQIQYKECYKSLKGLEGQCQCLEMCCKKSVQGWERPVCGHLPDETKVRMYLK